MSTFGNIKTSDDVVKQGDVIAGDYSPIASGMYNAKVKMAYARTSSGGALGVTIEFLVTPKTGEPKTVEQTFYVTNRNSENFYVKNGKKFHLPSYNTVNELCQLLTGKGLGDTVTEDRMLEIWNGDAQARVPTQVPVLTGLLDKDVVLCILQTRENKRVANSEGIYVDTEEERIFNEVDKVLTTKDNTPLTLTEQQTGITEATFAAGWVAKWKDKVRDRYKPVAGKSTATNATKPAVEIG